MSSPGTNTSEQQNQLLLGQSDRQPKNYSSTANKASNSSSSSNPLQAQMDDAQDVNNSQSHGGDVETFFHIVCITAGTGILQLPFALKEGGWMGIVYIQLAAVISAYTGQLLVKCLYYNYGGRLKSYSEVVEAAFGPWGRKSVRVLKDANLCGVSALYLILAGININSLISIDGEQFGARTWILASAFLVWLVIALAHEIHDIAIASIFGTLTTIVMVVIIIWQGSSDAAKQPERAPTKLFDAMQFPVSLASICFSFGGNINWPDLEANMKSPKHWNRILYLGTAFICMLYLCVAAVGYFTYGDNVKSPVLLSLPVGISVVVANVMVTAHVLLACPIILSAVFIEAERDLKINSERLSASQQTIYRVLFRTGLMGFIAFLALSIPFFGDFVALVGSFAASMVVFVLPTACYIRLYYNQHRFSIAETLWCGLIICVGLLCLIVGSTEAIRNLYNDFMHRHG